jgi:hypothetical protein
MPNRARLGVVAPQVLAEVFTEESRRDLLAIMRAHVDKAERYGIECAWSTQLVEACALFEQALGAESAAQVDRPHLRLVPAEPHQKSPGGRVSLRPTAS